MNYPFDWISQVSVNPSEQWNDHRNSEKLINEIIS